MPSIILTLLWAPDLYVAFLLSSENPDLVPVK